MCSAAILCFCGSCALCVCMAGGRTCGKDHDLYLSRSLTLGGLAGGGLVLSKIINVRGCLYMCDAPHEHHGSSSSVTCVSRGVQRLPRPVTSKHNLGQLEGREEERKKRSGLAADLARSSLFIGKQRDGHNNSTTMSGAWGTQAVERAPIEEIPLINEVHMDGLVRAIGLVQHVPSRQQRHTASLPYPRHCAPCSRLC